LNTSHLILLLNSPAFMASEYCNSNEMKYAVERHESREARVIPIILRPVDWHDAPFGKLQALPSSAQPVTMWRNRDKAFLDISRGIRNTLEELKLKQASPSLLPSPQLDRLIAKAIAERLDFLDMASLYEFLGPESETLPSSELLMLADHKY